jgi:hypothetical protein
MKIMNRADLRTFFCLATALAAPASFGATDQDKTQAQAVMLDHNEFRCYNCLFGISDYYFCFDANNRILIGHDRVRTQTWMKSAKDLMERGKTFPVRFDDKHIWVTRSNGKELKLKQDYTKKIFVESDRCRQAVK